MFFAPTVLALAGKETGNHVKILCLSSGTLTGYVGARECYETSRLMCFLGDADGLGSIRRKELSKSALHLGLRTEEDVYVVEDP